MMNARKANIAHFLKFASANRLDGVKAMMAKGVPVNAQDLVGVTALMAAARCGRSTIMSFLLDKGASAKMIDKHGNSSLHTAFFSADIKCVSLLVAAGADMDIKNTNQQTPFLFWVEQRIKDEKRFAGSYIKTEDPSDGLLFLARHGACVFVQNAKGLSAAQMIVEAPDSFGPDLVADMKSRISKKDMTESLPVQLGQAGLGRKL